MIGPGAPQQRVVAAAADHRVVARAARQRIVAGPAIDLVVVVGAIEVIVALFAEQQIIALAADQAVAAGAAQQAVIALPAQQRVIALAPQQIVVVILAIELVRIVAAVEIIVARAAEQRVAALFAGQEIGPPVAGQVVDPGAPHQRVVAGAPGQRVVAGPARQRVVAVAAVQLVVVIGAIEVIVTIAAEQRVIARPADQAVAAIAAGQAVMALVARKRVVAGIAQQRIVAVHAREIVVQGGAVYQVIARSTLARLRRKDVMGDVGEILDLEIIRRQRREIVADQLDGLAPGGDQRAAIGRGDGDLGHGIEPPQFRQDHPVLAQGEIGDRVGDPVAAHHKEIGPRPAAHRVGPGPVDQDVVAALAVQAVIAQPALDQVAGTAAGQRVGPGAAGLDRRQRPGIDAQMGDAGLALAAGEDLDDAILHMQGQGRDIGQRHGLAVGDLRQVQQPPPRQQREQRQPVIGAAGHHIDPVADGHRRHRLDRLEPRVQVVDHVIGDVQAAIRRHLQHADRAAAGAGDQQIGLARQGHRHQRRGRGDARPLGGGQRVDLHRDAVAFDPIAGHRAVKRRGGDQIILSGDLNRL